MLYSLLFFGRQPAVRFTSQFMSHQQQIAVIGGGVIGVCTAYFLAEAGHQVVVIERHSNVAEKASFGNAGVVAPGLCHALGHAGHAEKNPRLAVQERRPGAAQAQPRPRPVALGQAVAGRMRTGSLPRQQGAHAKGCRLQPSRPAATARTPPARLRTDPRLSATVPPRARYRTGAAGAGTAGRAGSRAPGGRCRRGARDRAGAFGGDAAGGRPATCPTTNPAIARSSPSN